MKVIVLKVRGAENLRELGGVIEQGRTFEGGPGGWQMPKDAQPGDLAVWYAGSPDQEYRAYCWGSGIPRKPAGQHFLLALGFDKRLAARELISDEVARLLQSGF